MFFGYRYIDIGGRYHPGETITSVEQVWAYCTNNMDKYPEIRITDSSDELVLHVINKEVVFPNCRNCSEVEKCDICKK